MDDKDRADAEAAGTNEGATPAAGPGVQQAAGSRRPRSDWTASDSRGPLVTASETSGSQTKGTEPTPAAGESDHRVEEPLVNDRVRVRDGRGAPHQRERPGVRHARTRRDIGRGRGAPALGPADCRRSRHRRLDRSGKRRPRLQRARGRGGPRPAGRRTWRPASTLVEKRPDGQADISALKTAIAALGDKVAALRERRPHRCRADGRCRPHAASGQGRGAPVEPRYAEGAKRRRQSARGQGVATLESDVAGTKKDSSTTQASLRRPSRASRRSSPTRSWCRPLPSSPTASCSRSTRASPMARRSRRWPQSARIRRRSRSCARTPTRACPRPRCSPRRSSRSANRSAPPPTGPRPTPASSTG